MAWGSQNLITRTLDPGKALRFMNVCGYSLDEDRDCLWDEQEFELANRFAPYLFMDEDEDCGIDQGWGPRVRFQVRPIAPDSTYTVANWKPNDGQLKGIHITYFMNWPLDCGTGPYHIGRHLGDSEKFTYLVATIDMNEFVLVQSTHNYHSDSSVRFGATARIRADLTGFDRPIIAAGQNKHASWWGRGLEHDDCAGSEDSSIDDCFGQNWKFDAESYLHVLGGGLIPAGYHENVHPIVLMPHNNIGEPLRTLFVRDPVTGDPIGQRPLVVATGGFLHSELEDPNQPLGDRRYFELPPGPLDGEREYWHNPPAGFGKFCGFLCRSSDPRQSDGDCQRNNLLVKPGYSESFGSCSSSLGEKLDRTPSNFGYPPPGSTSSGLTGQTCLGRSCTSRNFSNTGGCQCDEACHHFGDCCVDKVSICGDFDPSSCADKCGRRWTDRSQTCSCSYNCAARGDCCADAATLCPVEISTPSTHSCENRCGSPRDDYFTCACDHLCAARGDCCMDKTQACPLSPATVLGSCAGACGPTPGTAYGGLCYCDEACVDRGDCCLDAGLLCDVQLKGSSIPMVPGVQIERLFCAQRPAACRAIEHTHEVEVEFP